MTLIFIYNYIYFHCTMKIQSIHTLWTYFLVYLPGQGNQIGGWVPPVMFCSMLYCMLYIMYIYYTVCTSSKTHLFAYKHVIYHCKDCGFNLCTCVFYFFQITVPLNPALYQYQLVIFNIYFNKNDN